MKQKRIIAAFKALMLLALFSGYYVCNNFFFHTHTLNGRNIVHSHPFSSADHTHSANVISLLQVYNHMLLEKSEVLFFEPQELSVIYVSLIAELPDYHSAEILSLDTRAPPALYL